VKKFMDLIKKATNQEWERCFFVIDIKPTGVIFDV